MALQWRVELLGGLRAVNEECEITRFRTQQTGALLAYLAYHLRPHLRSDLIELLWPGSEPHPGSLSLRQALHALRQQLEPPGIPSGSILLTDRASVCLNPEAVTTDVIEFETALRSAARAESAAERAEWLAQAVERYRGELLSGSGDDWLLHEREWLAERYFQALEQWTAHLEQAGDLARAIEVAGRGVCVDPLREEAHRLLMRLYGAAGRPDAALRQYRTLEQILKQELDATPADITRSLARSIEARASGSASLPESRPVVPQARLEPVGGAVPLDSPFYVIRRTDEEFRIAVARQDSIVLVKGPREVGKTSLLARGLQHARRAGARVVLTDLEMFDTAHLASAETLLLAFAQTIADQLEAEIPQAATPFWDARRGASPNFRRFLQREVLGAIPSALVWGLDGVDRLFECACGGDIFALFRSWHNARSLDPAGPWSRLTLAISYSTEAHLFVTDLNRSPFNVGTRLTLEDFTLDHVADLNRRYGSPLKNETEVTRFYQLISGHPYLVRRGLHEMATHGVDIAVFEARAGSDDWIFGDHLARILVMLNRNPALCEVTRAVLQGRPYRAPDSFYRLRSAGILIGDSELDMKPRCPLYATYLERNLL